MDKRNAKQIQKFVYNHFEVLRGMTNKSGLVRSLKQYYSQNDLASKYFLIIFFRVSSLLNIWHYSNYVSTISRCRRFWIYWLRAQVQRHLTRILPQRKNSDETLRKQYMACETIEFQLRSWHWNILWSEWYSLLCPLTTSLHNVRRLKIHRKTLAL